MAPGVLVATSPSYSTTSTVVVAGDACVLVDPALTPGELDALVVALRDRRLEVHGGIATHAHWDHLLWPRELAGVPRWASPSVARHAHAGRAEHWAQAQEGGARPDGAVFAEVTPLADLHDGVAELPWRATEVRLHVHDAHAPGHVAVHLVRARVLLAGDMLSDLEVPLLDLAATDPVGDYAAGLDVLDRLVAACDVVVPGHGTPADRDEARRRLAADRAYLAALAAGREPDDPRATTPWIAEEHRRQVAALAGA